MYTPEYDADAYCDLFVFFTGGRIEMIMLSAHALILFSNSS